MNTWISVSDRMPITRESFGDKVFMTVPVIAFGDGMVAEMECQAGGAGGKFWVSFSSYGHISPELVTHWMPMPAPPEAA